jgi:cytochrome c556
MTPITYRTTAIMQQFQANMGALTAIRNGTVGTPAHVLQRALIIQALTKTLDGAFPPNSGGEGSRALPAIWTDAAGFTARIQAIQTAADALVTAARGTDMAAVGTAQMAVQQACGACHMAFRGPAPGN